MLKLNPFSIECASTNSHILREIFGLTFDTASFALKDSKSSTKSLTAVIPNEQIPNASDIKQAIKRNA